jgi:cytidylate kinase
MTRVITIGREFGSGGSLVGTELASRLEWRLVDAAIIDEIVQSSGVDINTARRCDERVDSAFHRVFKSLWHGGFVGSVSTTAASTVRIFDSDAMARLSRFIIERAAAEGNCIIIGRGGQCVLQHRTDTLQFFIYAPWHEKVRRVKDRMPNESDVEGLIQKMDRQRSEYIRRYFNQDWCDRHLYHGMFSSSLGVKVVADCIMAAMNQPESLQRDAG